MSEQNKPDNEPVLRPDEKSHLQVSQITELWKAGKINFGEYRRMISTVMHRQPKPLEQTPTEITLKVDYVRNFPCAACNKPLTATKALHGWILVCGCIPTFSRSSDIYNHPWWDKVE